MSTKSVTPDVNGVVSASKTVTEDVSKRENASVSSVAPKLVETKVTIEDGKEDAAILYKSTVAAIALAFSLQDSYDNPSQFQRDALQDASVMFLKAQCQRSIATWDNLVTKMTKLQKYQSMTRKQVEDALVIHPKCKPIHATMLKAVAIKANLK